MVQLTIFYGYRIDSVAKTLKSWRKIHDVFTIIIIYYGCYSNVDTTLNAQRQTLFRGRYYDVARTFCQLCEERQIISMVLPQRCQKICNGMELVWCAGSTLWHQIYVIFLSYSIVSEDCFQKVDSYKLNYFKRNCSTLDFLSNFKTITFPRICFSKPMSQKSGAKVFN